MLVSINKIYRIADEESQYGPQKNIKFIDAKGTTLSGWVSLKEFDPSAWVVGGQVDLEIKQNGKYTNFKLIKSSPKQPIGNGGSGKSEEVVMALHSIYKILKSIDEKLSKNTTSAPGYPSHVLGEEEAPF